MASSPPPNNSLDPSPLGTKEYWDNSYSLDLTNYASDPSNTGTSWFSDSDAEEKILSYLESLHLDAQNTSFLDLGTGNGSMLFLLRAVGFEGKMVGVDYSAASVKLVREIAAEKRAGTGNQGQHEIVFAEWDVMKEEAGEWMVEGGFDVVLDKGTFDAISLNEEVDEHGRRVCAGYRRRVERLMGKDGMIMVTSCNWTEEELRGWFEGEEFEVKGRIEYPKFTFGGKTGQSISTLCFQRRQEL